MITTTSAAELRKLSEDGRTRGTVGFVPTMGALHEGHRSLIRRARAECDTVVVSIFVNPTQFGPHEDLEAYPRPLADDLAACDAEGADVVFHPEPAELYPDGERTTVSVGGLTERMEGAHRPGHFDGVALVCTKLFAILGACRAYFGEKDAQQLRVIRRLVTDLALPVDVVGCPIVRDDDGLALSSRNAYLDAGERERALSLGRALRAVEAAAAAGETDVAVLHAVGLRELEPADAVDYLEFCHPDTLEPVRRVSGAVLVCVAARIGTTRLIDNVTIGTAR